MLMINQLKKNPNAAQNGTQYGTNLNPNPQLALK